MGAARPTVFVCYSSSDRYWCHRVCSQLATLVADCGIEVRRDETSMRAGDKLHDEIAAAIDRSAIAVLLVSDAFNDPDRYARKHEVPRIMARAARGALTVIPLQVAASALPTEEAPWHGTVVLNGRERPLAGLNEAEATSVLAALEAQVKVCVQVIDDARPATNWVNALVRGVSAATAEHVRAFVTEYVSTAQHKVAFGGRGRVLTTLRDWVDDTTAAAHCFLIAPTGRGKSATVCHLVQALAGRTDLAVVFLPVSLRFGTSGAGALRHALVDRLLTLHRAPPLGLADLATTLASMSARLRQALPDERRLLLVIDGLDEATDWELGAGQLRDLAPGTKVLISMRGTVAVDARALRDRLQLPAGSVLVETLTLLDRAAVAEALASAGHDRLAADPVRLTQLVKLSEGDPLVLRLLLDELTDRGEDAFFASAPDLKPGLASLWKRQLTEADREAFGQVGATTSLFAILATALGPVGQADLLALAPADLPNGVVLDRTLDRWRRFVLRTEAGYSFFYPRLQQFYAEEMMSADDRARWQTRILDHGRAAVAKLAAEPRVPPSPFVLQFHGAHLERYGGALDDFARLVTPSWRDAWAQQPTGDAGFVRDVERVWNAAVERLGDAPNTRVALAVAVRCALTRATMRSEWRNLSPALLQALLAHQLWTPERALAYLSSKLALTEDETPDHHVRLIEALHPFLRTRSLQRAGLDLAARIARRGGTIEPWQRLAEALGPAEIDALESSARDVPHLPYRLRALLTVAEAHPDRSRRVALQHEVADLIRESPSTSHLIASLEAIGFHLAAMDSAERAALMTLARTRIAEVPDHGQRARLSGRLAEQLHGDDRAHFARDAYHACSLEDPPDVQRVLALLPLMSVDEARVALARLIDSDVQSVVPFLRGEVSTVRPGDLWRTLIPFLDARRHDALVTAWISAAVAQPWPRLDDLLDAGFSDQVLAAVRELPPERRDPALAVLGPHLNGEEQLAVVARLMVNDDHPRGWLDALAISNEDLDAARRFLADFGDAAAGRIAAAALLPADIGTRSEPLYVVPGAALTDVPFAALPIDGQPLVEHRAVALLPGLAALGCRPGPSPWTTARVYLGDAAGDLPAAAGEVRRLGGDSARVGDAADRGSVRAARDASLLHVAVHGPVTRAGGALELADGPLTAAEIVTEGIAPRVAVLTGCGTGASAGLDAEGWGGFPTAFLAAGSAFVIATLRSVPDAEAAVVVDAYYAADPGLDPVARLAAAQRQLITESRRAIATGQPAPVAPSVWASFAAWGDAACGP